MRGEGLHASRSTPAPAIGPSTSSKCLFSIYSMPGCSGAWNTAGKHTEGSSGCAHSGAGCQAGSTDHGSPC